MEKTEESFWIETYNGTRFHILDPSPDEIFIQDIAHALSMLCRFNGQCGEFYSIAQHCVHVADYVGDKIISEGSDIRFASYPDIMLRALLHDAAESYCSDVPRPWKKAIPEIKNYEDLISEVIYKKYGCSTSDIEPGLNLLADAVIREADDVMLATEARDLDMNIRNDWTLNAAPMDLEIKPMTQSYAKQSFLEMFFFFHKG